MSDRFLKNVDNGRIFNYTNVLAAKANLIEVDEEGTPLGTDAEAKGADYWKTKYDELKLRYDDLERDLMQMRSAAREDKAPAEPAIEEPAVEDLLAAAGAVPVTSGISPEAVEPTKPVSVLEADLAAFTKADREGKAAFRKWAKDAYGFQPEMKYSLDRMKDMVRARASKQAA